ncbi:MAG: hypothetical protein ACI8P0_001262, partial [Planctomycetaceae bacterium]
VRLAEHSSVLRQLRKSHSITDTHSVISQNRCHWADARSYVLPPLRGSKLRNFKTHASGFPVPRRGVSSYPHDPEAAGDRA